MAVVSAMGTRDIINIPQKGKVPVVYCCGLVFFERMNTNVRSILQGEAKQHQGKATPSQVKQSRVRETQVENVSQEGQSEARQGTAKQDKAQPSMARQAGEFQYLAWRR